MNIKTNNKKCFIKQRNLFIGLIKSLKSFYQCLCMLACIIFYTAISTSAFAAPIITNTATVNYSIGGTAQTLTDSVQFTKDAVVLPSDTITLVKQASPATLIIGEVITYTLVVTNPNGHALNNIVIQDTLPAGLVYQTGSSTLNTASINNTNINLAGNLLSLTLGNMPANSTWEVNYDAVPNIAGNALVNNAIVISDTATSSQAQASVKVLGIPASTPATIKFLKINSSGVPSPIPSTAYNNGQSGGLGWVAINNIMLPDGSTITTPNSQPIIDAGLYSIREPVIIEVKDLDENTDTAVVDTIFVTVTIPGTNDTEVLLLQETSANSGVFRGIINTTADPSTAQNGILSIQEGDIINVSYRDQNDLTDSHATAALVVPNTPINLSKSANKDSATMGELVKYTVTFNNNTNAPIPTFNLVDTLPLGFKYIPGSAKLNSTVVTTGITTNGRTLNIALTNMPSGQTWSIEYLTKISAGTQVGKAVNSALVFNNSFKSNTATAIVLIKDDLMRSQNILTGRVYIGCNTGKNSQVLKNTRIYTETGRSVLSDVDGFWHMEGIQAGTHVLQVDTLTLPAGYEPLLCQDNTRRAGDAKSQFVNLQAGSLWHVDFHVAKIEGASAEGQTVKDDKVEAINPFKLYGKEYTENAAEGFEVIWPKHNYVPAVASTSIMVKSSPQHIIEVFLNGEKVSPLNYDGSSTNKARTINIKRWKGVDLNIKNRDNTLLVIAKDKSGKEIVRKTQNIHFSGEPASVEYLPEQSILIADGKTIPIIAVRVKDKDGFPARANTHGYLKLNNSVYQLKSNNGEDAETSNLSESSFGSYKYHIEQDGIAKIKLNPTTQSGEVSLRFDFSSSQKPSTNIRAWLKPQLRDWILVGVAEGTLAHKTLTGNIQALSDLGKSDKFYKRGRVAFFAKGQIQGKYLLTIAYDTHKMEQKVGTQLNSNIDPDAWYTVYGDNSNSQYNAPSSKNLYLKIEKDQFYTVFGDYQTNMNITTLAKYERVLNGLKSEYKGTNIQYNAFVSQTSNQYHHDEIPGDGTSGLYHLSSDILPNSETIKIETRDRFHSERVIETRVLIRYRDYNIDYSDGALFFNFPISGRDQNFNPNIIIVDYDSETNNNHEIVAGGRVAYKTDDDKLEVGVSSLLIKRNTTKNDALVAVDANYNITPDTKLHVEVATSNSRNSNYQDVNAQIIELEKQFTDLEAKIYYRKHGEKFGIEIQNTESGTEKTGASISYKLNEKNRLNAEVSLQKNTANDNQRKLAEIGITHKNKQFGLNAGLRHTKEELSTNSIINDTFVVGGNYTTDNGKLNYRVSLEKNIKSSGQTERSPNRLTLGVDYKVMSGLSLFAEHEITENETTKTQNTRVGINKSLWEGANATSTYTREFTDLGQRDYATLGLNQQIKISETLHADISIDHAKTIQGTQVQLNTNEPEVQGSQRDDYTAFSVGLASHIKDWNWTTRFEARKGDLSEKLNVRAGLIHTLTDGQQFSAKFNYTDTQFTNGGYDNNIKLSLGSAWHPKDSTYVFFNRLDLIDQKENTTGTSSTNMHTQKIIHNMHYSHTLNSKTKFSIHHGIKSIKDNNQGTENNTIIDTATVTLRRDLNKQWDIGIHGGYLRDWKGGKATESVAGISIGVTPAKDIWAELGYNFEGFSDDDFDSNEYTRKGVYLNFSYKFDQDSFKGLSQKNNSAE